MPLRITIAFIAIHALAATGNADVVRLHATATVDGNVIYLDDVATLSMSDSTIQLRMADIVLAPAPIPGGRTRLRVEQIQSRLAAHGFTTATIDYQGSSLVLVERRRARPTPKVKLVAHEAPPSVTSAVPHRRPTPTSVNRRQAETLVRTIVADYLAANAPDWGNPLIEPTLLNADVDPVNIAGRQLTIQSGRQLRNGYFELSLTDEPGAAVVPIVTVRVRIRVRPRVYAARLEIAKGQTIRQSDLKLVEVDDAANGLTSADAIVGLKAKRSIKAGTPILETQVEAETLINRNDVVSVHAGSGGIRIVRQFKALESGALGDVITFQLPSDRTVTVSAQVTGSQTAEVIATRPVAAR